MTRDDSASARTASQLLSGYLCGTHSGFAAAGRRARGRSVPGPRAVAAVHRTLTRMAPAVPNADLGVGPWAPDGDATDLADELRNRLSHPGVIELVVFGSQARGGTTGFSDLDAVLVISDEAVDDPETLSTVRPHVLAAQRAVITYQPMQHHGFEVATPRLLRAACAALGLPAVALEEARSLNGKRIGASLSGDGFGNGAALRSLARGLAPIGSWPRHPWSVHRLVAMFELLPVLYVQDRGASVPKWRSFDEARGAFGRSWWPYDVLNEVRLSWPRRRRPGLEVAATLGRNPWAAIAAWRRIPAPIPESVRPLLTERCLSGLQRLSRAMSEGVQ